MTDDRRLLHVGDSIDKNLTGLAAQKIKRKLLFSKEGAADLESFCQEVFDNLELSRQHSVRSDPAPSSHRQLKVR